MLIYRVEARYSGINGHMHISPYGHIAPDTALHLYLDENGINYRRFIHHIDFDDPIELDILRHRAPAPYMDKGLKVLLDDYYVGDYHFGFESSKCITNWFSVEEIETLIDSGFYIAVFDVNRTNCLIGDKQILFKIEKAVQIGCIYLQELI